MDCTTQGRGVTCSAEGREKVGPRSTVGLRCSCEVSRTLRNLSKIQESGGPNVLRTTTKQTKTNAPTGCRCSQPMGFATETLGVPSACVFARVHTKAMANKPQKRSPAVLVDKNPAGASTTRFPEVWGESRSQVCSARHAPRDLCREDTAYFPRQKKLPNQFENGILR